jgi:hypothetical protein
MKLKGKWQKEDRDQDRNKLGKIKEGHRKN